MFKPIARAAYYSVLDKPDLHPSEGGDFAEVFFDSREEYENLVSESNEIGIRNLLDKALGQYEESTAGGSFGQVDSELASACYSLIRKAQPTTIVETGVCNGVSTLFILKALAENDNGALYSVDYPYHADESLEEFRNETFEQYGGAAIPSDRQPGWIVPDDLRDMWELRVGKSQLQLPPLLEELEEVDLFIHDSEHSHPCMMFEYELAWHRMESGGVILSDDIRWNNAFSVFKEVRNPIWGTLNPNVGFMIKS
jgi:predicted O-methyltransferase YrrM